MVTDDRLPWLGLVLLAPIAALCLIAAHALSDIARSNAQVGSAEVAAEMAARAAVVMDDLQSERSNAAALRLSGPLLSEQQYRDRIAGTDRTIANLLALADSRAGGLTQDGHDRLSRSLAGLEEARALGLDTEAPLGVAVNAYTGVLKSFMDTFAAELTHSHGGERRFTTAFVLLARLHERIAIETSVGLNGFYSGAVDPQSHRVLLEAIAPQEALIQGFKDLAGPDWSQRLDEVLTGVNQDRLTGAREALIATAYGAPLDSSHRTFWREERLPIYFDLAVFRSRFAQDGISQIRADAEARNAAAIRSAGIQILILLLASGAAVLGFARLAGARRDADPLAPGFTPAE